MRRVLRQRCDQCDGRGQIWHWAENERNASIMSITHVSQCFNCGGTGSIEYTAWGVQTPVDSFFL